MNLPLTNALAPLADEHGYDLTSFREAEQRFDQQLADTIEWARDTRLVEVEDLGPGRVAC